MIPTLAVSDSSTSPAARRSEILVAFPGILCHNILGGSSTLDRWSERSKRIRKGFSSSVLPRPKSGLSGLKMSQRGVVAPITICFPGYG
jgi:hypothetical protein